MKKKDSKLVEELKRRDFVCRINNEISKFNNTRDARFFWRAFLLIQEAGEEIPKEFMEQINSYARVMLNAKCSKDLALDLELFGDKKNHLGLEHSLKYTRRWKIASEVETLIKVSNLNRLKTSGSTKITAKQAISSVAKKRGMTSAHVHKIYYDTFRASSIERENKGRNSGLALQMHWH